MEKAWTMGILAGALLALAVPPLSTPLFSFFIFTPLVFLAAARPELSSKKLFISGFLAGAIGGGWLAFCILHDFAWPPDAPLVLALIHWSPVLWGVLFGCVFGGGLVLYKTLRFVSPLLNAALFASLYTLFEQALQIITGHYYVGALAYTVTFFHASFALASIGGELLVSFTVVYIGALVGELLALENTKRRHLIGHAVLVFAGVALVCVANTQYLHTDNSQPLQVAVIQTGDRSTIPFAHNYEGVLLFPTLAATLQDAATDSNLVIYPLAVVNEALYVDAPPPEDYKSFGSSSRTTLETWMADNSPTSTTVVTWDITYEQGKYLQNYNFWHGGELAAVYSKRKLYAFTEFTPTFAHFGFGPTPVPISPSTSNGLAKIPGGVTVGNLQCSEVHLSGLARGDSINAQVLLAIGLEWIFPNDMGEVYSLGATRYRAAENNIPAIRASAEGPSALIDARGIIVGRLDFNQQSILRGTLEAPIHHRQTVYSILGTYPLFGGIAALFVAAYIRKRRIIFPGIQE